MRTIVCLTILLAVVFMFCTMGAWGQINYAEIGVQIFDAGNKLLEAQETLDYAKEVGEAAKDNKPIPPMDPHIRRGKTLVQQLEETKNQLESIQIPDEESADAPNLPTVAQITSSDVETARAALNSAVENAAGRAKQLPALKQVNEAIDKVVALDQATVKATRLLADAFGQIYEKAPLVPLIEVFGFAWYDLEANFIPRATDILDLAQKKQKMLAKALDQRSKGFENMVANLKTLLASEAQNQAVAQTEREAELAKSKEEAKEVQIELLSLTKELEEGVELLDQMDQEQDQLNKEGKAFNDENEPLREEEKVLREMERLLAARKPIGISASEYKRRVEKWTADTKKAIEDYGVIKAKLDECVAKMTELDAGLGIKDKKHDELEEKLKDLNLKCDSVQADLKRIEEYKAQNQQDMATLSSL